MVKELARYLDYAACAESSLGLSALSLAVIFYGVLRLSPGAADRFASIALSDDVQDPRT